MSKHIRLICGQWPTAPSTPTSRRATHATANDGKTGGAADAEHTQEIGDGGFDTPYRLRQQIVEPVFGQIKQARGFLLHGVESACRMGKRLAPPQPARAVQARLIRMEPARRRDIQVVASASLEARSAHDGPNLKAAKPTSALGPFASVRGRPGAN